MFDKHSTEVYHCDVQIYQTYIPSRRIPMQTKGLRQCDCPPAQIGIANHAYRWPTLDAISTNKTPIRTSEQYDVDLQSDQQ
jgi:hypothetical protein